MTDDASPSDRDWLRRIEQRDDRALAALYDQHAPSLYGLALAMVREPRDAEEVVEDAFIKLWETPAAYDPDRGSLVAYLTIVVRSKALDSLRASRRRAAAVERAAASTADGVATPVSPLEPGPQRRLEREQIAQAMRSAMATLPEPQRVALELAYFNGYSQSEIASELAEPLGTVKSRIRSGMLNLRDAMAPFWKEAGR